MIIVNIKGGLGNQMFQYALGRTLSLKNKDVLKLDISGLDHAKDVGDTHRPFVLDVFTIQNDIANEHEIRKIKYPYGIISKIGRSIDFKILRHTHVLFEEEILKKTGDLYLDGYWQSPRYFENNRDVLLKDFTLKEMPRTMETIKNQMSECPSVSLHVRRGDYVTNPRVGREFGMCSIDYYREAIAYMQKHIDAPHFFVFSDDMAWAKQNLPLEEEHTFVEDSALRTVDDLVLMSACKHNIIANSTFSWWGAWLNTNPNKIVIAPKPWFDNSPYDSSLLPHSWIHIQK